MLKSLAMITAFCLVSAASVNAAPVDGNAAYNAYLAWFSGWMAYLEATYPTVEFFASTNFSFGGGGFRSILADIYAFDVPTSGALFKESFLWNAANGNVFANSAPVAVPGPEAGVGIGALALGGLGYLIHRRHRMAKAA